MLAAGIPLAVAAVVTGLGKHLVGDEVLACTVRIDYGLNQVLRNVVVVRKQLLRILRKTVAAVAERWVVVVRTYTRVEAYAIYDRLCIKAFHLGIGVKLVEVADTQGEVGIGKELHCLGLGAAHKKHIHILLDCAFPDDRGE